MDGVLSQTAFDKFLAYLDPDRERAGDEYLKLRHSLTRILEWKGSLTPEEHADQTVDRVCRKLEEGLVIDDLPKYCRTVLNFVYLESLKKPDSRREELDEQRLAQISAPDPPDDDARFGCLDKCLGKLPADHRDLIGRYYRDDQVSKIENRKRLAEELGVTAHNLNVRASRIREKLHGCVTGCLKDL